MTVRPSSRFHSSSLTTSFRSAMVISASVAFSASGAMAQNLLLNGSFENPIGPEWSASGNLGRTNGVPLPFNTSDGTFAMGWNSGNAAPNGLLQQTFSTIPGVSYTLSFDFGKWSPGFDPGGIASLRVELISGATALLDQTVSDSTGLALDWWDSYSFVFTATATSTELRFADLSNATFNYDGNLDNVSVVPAPSAAAFLGVAGLMAARRRR